MKQSLTIPICVLLFSTPMYAAPCGIEGSAQKGSREYTLNRFKNRSQGAHAINPSIILKRLARGDTFQNTQAAAVIDYVALVNPDGKETCNRKAEDAAHKDTPSCHWNQSSSPVSAMLGQRSVWLDASFRRRLQPRTNET